ncbi:MAG: FIG056164: rhomboid family serine protease [uncultured Gemmatimonadetes bacterium]|uniref:FIG056164: rhomboid family serine protease n=1 Tax=uncultured Gemmatimonadota bacterium TaxID=203437 RepID=A0A6J4M4T3_9BACT|nr:MAG: FIG056164: rhomboid family serine protease [uncultured Gemmatimonadota bacterium]
MLPISDENPTEIRPVVTVALILLNVYAWFQLQGAGTEMALEASVMHFGTIPCEITGACPAEGLSGGTILTSMFMHGSWEHIIGNMLFLWVFGNNIEDSMGHLRFLVFYLLCGAMAGGAHIFFNLASPVPAVGASGAISGVMGAYIVLYPHARVRTWFPPIFLFHVRAMFFLAYWFILQLAMAAVEVGSEAGEQGGVAVWAHVGGFVAGVALVKVFENRTLTHARRAKIQLTPHEVARARPWL